jgi:hypothetical protein
MSESKKAVGYIRTHASENNTSLSEHGQRQLLKIYADRHGIELLAVVCDRTAGYTPLYERAGGAELLKIVREEPLVNMVLTLSVDRLFAGWYDRLNYARDCKRLGIEIHSIETAPSVSTKQKCAARILGYVNRNGARAGGGDGD